MCAGQRLTCARRPTAAQLGLRGGGRASLSFRFLGTPGDRTTVPTTQRGGRKKGPRGPKRTTKSEGKPYLAAETRERDGRAPGERGGQGPGMQDGTVARGPCFLPAGRAGGVKGAFVETLRTSWGGRHRWKVSAQGLVIRQGSGTVSLFEKSEEGRSRVVRSCLLPAGPLSRR